MQPLMPATGSYGPLKSVQIDAKKQQVSQAREIALNALSANAPQIPSGTASHQKSHVGKAPRSRLGKIGLAMLGLGGIVGAAAIGTFVYRRSFLESDAGNLSFDAKNLSFDAKNLSSYVSDENVAVKLYLRDPALFKSNYYSSLNDQVRRSDVLRHVMMEHFLSKWNEALQTMPSTLPLLQEGTESAWEAYVDQHFTSLFALLPQNIDEAASQKLFFKCIKEYPGDLLSLVKNLKELSGAPWYIHLRDDELALATWNAFQESPFHKQFKGRSRILQKVVMATTNKDILTNICDYDFNFFYFVKPPFFWDKNLLKLVERQMGKGLTGYFDHDKDIKRWRAHQEPPVHCNRISPAEIKNYLKQTPLQRAQSNLDPTCPSQLDPMARSIVGLQEMALENSQAQLLLFNRVAKNDTEVEEIYKQFSNYMFTCNTIKHDYRQISKEIHPDKVAADQKAIVQEAFTKISTALEQFCYERPETDPEIIENGQEPSSPNPLAVQN